MASFSDDEQMFDVDSVIDQRKRKGIVEYLVQWKGAESGKDTSWEPATRIAEDFASAVAKYIKSKTRKRSQSKTRKPSRSRSRSNSRSRKAKTEKVVVRRSTRSTSRGRSSKIPVSEKKAEEQKPKEEKKSEEQVKSVEERTEVVAQKSVEHTKPVASVSQTESVSSTTVVSTTVVSSTSSSSSSESVSMSGEKKTEARTSGSDRVLRSATKAPELEIQRVHTELRPVHVDDGKPRSSVWKVADYLVIALFVLSVLAAIFLFVEKFVDLKDFRPNLGTLQTRLSAGVQGVLDVCRAGGDRASGAWLSLMDLVGSGAAKK